MTGGVLVEARILGRIELVSGEVRLSLGGTKQRAVLAMHVLEANRVVSNGRRPATSTRPVLQPITSQCSLKVALSTGRAQQSNEM